FGADGGPARFYAITPGPYGALLGSSAAPGTSTSPGRVSIDSASSYARFDPAAGVVRCLVAGTLRGVPGVQPVVAVTVGGRVAAVTRAFLRGGEIRFHAMIPLEAFRKGTNVIEVYLVEARNGAPSLRRIALAV
ncbi:MAG: hypothetical protein ACRDJ1_10290, partial [Actinomycetota bacterium]